LEKATSEVRTISYLLHPPMLDDLGLEYALGWVARGFTQRSGIHVDLELRPNMERLSPELELTLFRIVQEALTNIHRHSGSPSAKIALSRHVHEVTLEVTDVGRGIPSGALGLTRDAAASLGVGISGMRERVRQLGGRLEIMSSSRGTTIRTVLPLIISQDGSPTRVQALLQFLPLMEGSCGETKPDVTARS
jgi:signal transduction histidine kinase